MKAELSVPAVGETTGTVDIETHEPFWAAHASDFDERIAGEPVGLAATSALVVLTTLVWPNLDNRDGEDRTKP